MFRFLSNWHHLCSGEFLHVLDDESNRDIFLLLRAPRQQLDLALGKLLAANRNSIGNSDEVRILELDARPLIPVIEQHLESGLLKLGADLGSATSAIRRSCSAAR